MKSSKADEFSLALGLFDYINPIFYSITAITIINNTKGIMNKTLFVIFVVGAIISIIFGFTIPTVKAAVGLGKMKFKMPVNLVAYVNSGILLSGVSLMSFVLKVKPVLMGVILVLAFSLLVYIYIKTKKINTIAVLIGAVGYLMIYVSLIVLAISHHYYVSAFLYGFAICLFVFLCAIGIKSNLMKAKVHWVIEISNVICQFSVALGTVLLFKNIVL